MQPGDPDLAKKNARVAMWVAGLVFCMVGLAFASVPLYDLFCRVTGYGGTTQRAEEFSGQVVERPVRVRFNADVNAALPWEFRPEINEITLNLGENGLMAYEARNRTARQTAGVAVYNVTPVRAGKYFHKVECFCFLDQPLGPGEEVSMPVWFYIDPAMADDPAMEDVTTITLSYTFFAAESDALSNAQEELISRDPENLPRHVQPPQGGQQGANKMTDGVTREEFAAID